MSGRRQPPRPRGSSPGAGKLRRLPRLPSARRPRRRLPFSWPRLPIPSLPAGLARGAGRAGSTRRRFSPTRAGALLAALVSGGALYGAGASDAFGFDHLELSGLRWTDDAAVRALVDVPDGANLFALATSPIARKIASLPPVAAVRVDVRLPDTIVIRVTERQALLVWQVNAEQYLVDRAGIAFALLDPAAVPGLGLQVVSDVRAATPATLAVGRAVQPVDLDAATRLASLVPADVGSEATALAVEVSDANGFVVRSVPAGWTAIFGFYTPNLRTTDLIPGQVRLLRSLIAGREASVEQVILADELNGTYIPKPTATLDPNATPAPSP